ncbi:endolytic transglycosylase MltG [Naumannella halotolerans]|uniref:Endolytic murein transglycosylase n=1 Tax=Naumannella halotolerans TaxID=993414 RepID=A0A4R7JA48_9ACTN|nr:endolytic transglycosylase MltG [Naumannella halotolerans]TDT33487.1 UPF0755 protein [Naumannella halotolerans]
MSDHLDTRPSERAREEFSEPPKGFNLRNLAYHGKSAAAVIVALVVLVGGGWFALSTVQSQLREALTSEDYLGPGEEEILIEVPSGAGVSEIGSILVEHDVIRSTDAWSDAVNAAEEEVNLQAGWYQMLTQMSAEQALDRMLDPNALDQEKVTVREALRLEEQYEEISEATDFSVEELEAAGADGEAYGLSPWAEGNPEGFLFPDTYNVQTAAGPIPVLSAMATQFESVADDVELEKRAEELGYTPRELVVVASIIEAEVRRDEDRPKVARVLYNRLEQGMPLQLDTTVKYANGVRGNSQTTEEERKFDSPYNTYLYEGLPPGPIGAPGKSGLEAAANPADGNWLYFVAVDLETGETKFADDAAGHQANVEEYRQWCWDNQGKC